MDIFGFSIHRSDAVMQSDTTFSKYYDAYKACTMTSKERMYALYQATTYVTQSKILGDIVECGVWKGGSCMMAAQILAENNDTQRNIYLYDTFDGMTQPTDIDTQVSNMKKRALDIWHKKTRSGKNIWCNASLTEVKENMKKTTYPSKNILFVKGKVENTLKKSVPIKIALLRLDTDWYESTKVELETLYPKLAKGGVLILDDYGYWNGARKAVDEYFADKPILLIRIDNSGRMIIKQ